MKVLTKIASTLTAIIFCLTAVDVRSQSSSDKILELMNLVNFAYVDSVDLDKLSEAAIISILEELDPHSLYIPKEKVQEMNESLDGSFDGIGIQFEIFRDSILVVTAISGGPSREIGIRSGDRIIAAQGEVLSGKGLTDDDVIEQLRGKKGSKLDLLIKRTGVKEELNFEVTRDRIPINSVDAAFMLSEEIGYIKINRFSKTTYSEFEKALKALNKQDMEDLVLDLRGNGGGYLYSAVQIADELVSGKDVIVSTEGLNQSRQVFHAKSKGSFTSGKLIVLIDEGTASASEILAGCIQDWDRGILIGRRSFGKGLVMKPFTLGDGSMVRLTTSRYYTPSGRCIQKDYSESKENYEDEIHHRFEKGEFFSLDSIDLPNELKFKTREGRTVYGGGGILPDIFFPADTMLLGDRYQEILKSGLVVEFTLDYADRNRKSLVKKYNEAIELYNDSDLSILLIHEFDILLKEKGYAKGVSSDMSKALSRQLKAFIAQYLWDEKSYYLVISQDQGILNKAVDVLNDWDQNWTMLSERVK